MKSLSLFDECLAISIGWFLFLVPYIRSVDASPIEIQYHQGVDACSAYIPKGGTIISSGLVGIQVIALNSSASLGGCSEIAARWSDPFDAGKRCRTACWYHHRLLPGKSLKNQCVCLVDPIWMPRSGTNNKNNSKEDVSSSRLLWPCRNDGDCSYNGRCRENGRCQCSDAWKGPTCGELDILPVEKGKLGLRQVDKLGSNISSWGAPILWDETSKLWHGYASEIQDGCGINAWETNSRIVHIIGGSPYGPFQKRAVVFPAFSHEPSVVRGPSREWVMLFSSYRYNATGLEEVLCKSCKGGVTPEISGDCPYQLGNPENLHHRFRQMMSISRSPYGPWSSPVEIPQLSQGWDWNTDLTINGDGSAVALIRGGTTVHASNYSDPSTWRILSNDDDNNDDNDDRGSSSNLEFPQWDGASVEDPHIWQQQQRNSNGVVYHAIAHAFSPFYGVHAYATIPSSSSSGASFDWSRPLKWTVTGVAYGNVVHFTDGSQHAYSRRERPHLLWGGGGSPGSILALSNGVQFAGRLREEYRDGVFTLVQPVRSKTSNVSAVITT